MILHEILKWMMMLFIVLLTPVSFSTENGEDILEEKCTLCHDRPDPAKLTMKKWKIKVGRMAPRAGLSTAETTVLIDYASSLAKDAASVMSMTKEKELFNQKCSLCHTTTRALIMPMTPESVKEIVARMQTMAGNWIDDDQAHFIEEYLVHGAPGSKRPTRSEIEPADNYALFLQRCTACHTAEQVFSRLKSDKKGTTVADWEKIVDRMRQKAPNWIIRSEAENITGFLGELYDNR